MNRAELEKLRRLKELKDKAEPKKVEMTGPGAGPFDPSEGMNPFEAFGAKFNAGLTDLNLGLAQRAADVGNVLTARFDRMEGDKNTWMDDANEWFQGERARLKAKAEEKQRLESPLMKSGKGFGGYVAGTSAPSLLAPEANPSLVGAVNNFSLPTTSDEQTATNTGVGALVPPVVKKAFDTAGRVISPLVSRNAPELAEDASQEAIKRAQMVKMLRDKGVELTPGQIAGGMPGRIESGLESIPGTGDAIKAAKLRGVQSFNRAAINEALEPLGLTLPENLSGREAIEWMNSQASNAYDSFLPNTAIKADQQFSSELNNLTGLIQGSNIPAELKKEFEDVIRRDVVSRMSRNGTISGDDIKMVDSAIRQAKERFAKSPDAWQRDIGNAFGEVRKSLKGLIARGDPQAKAAMDAADAAYARVMKIRDASIAAGSKNGEFSPTALASVVSNAAKKSGNRRGLSEGRAVLQGTAEAAKEIMGNKVPDSGTPFRAATGLAASGAASPLLGFGPLLANAGGMAAYSTPGEALINAILYGRPQVAENVASGLTKTGKAISPAMAPLFARMLMGDQ